MPVKIHEQFKLNGHGYSNEELKEVAYSLIKEGVDFEKEIGDFLLDWLSSDSELTVRTSGSTGLPLGIVFTSAIPVRGLNFIKLSKKRNN